MLGPHCFCRGPGRPPHIMHIAPLPVPGPHRHPSASSAHHTHPATQILNQLVFAAISTTVVSKTCIHRAQYPHHFGEQCQPFGRGGAIPVFIC